MKILPFVLSHIPFLTQEGKIEALPLQVFRLKNGMTIIRIGDNIIKVNSDGSYDGVEARIQKREGETENEFSARQQEYIDLLEDSEPNSTPASTYFSSKPEDSELLKDEVRGWPKNSNKQN